MEHFKECKTCHRKVDMLNVNGVCVDCWREGQEPHTETNVIEIKPFEIVREKWTKELPSVKLDEGKHYDEGKLRIELVPPEAIEAIAEVLTKHVSKYGERNWEKGIKFSRLLGSCLRHLLAFEKGKDTDAESGIHALKHLLTDVAFLVTYIERGMLQFDDRPKKEKN